MIKTIIKPMRGRTIPLGVQGENLARDIDFTDLRDEFAQAYGAGGEFRVVALRPGEAEPYPVVNLDDAGEALLWHVDDIDTARAGNGAVEVSYIVDGRLAKSFTYPTHIVDALGEPGEVPSAGTDYIEVAYDVLEQVEAIAGSMAYPYFETTADGHVVIQQADRLGPTSFDINESTGHLGVTF
jgi:hypothetical protein